MRVLWVITSLLLGVPVVTGADRILQPVAVGTVYEDRSYSTNLLRANSGRQDKREGHGVIEFDLRTIDGDRFQRAVLTITLDRFATNGQPNSGAAAAKMSVFRGDGIITGDEYGSSSAGPAFFLVHAVDHPFLLDVTDAVSLALDNGWDYLGLGFAIGAPNWNSTDSWIAAYGPGYQWGDANLRNNFSLRVSGPGKGDVNCDGHINSSDVEPLLVALFEPEEYARRWAHCDIRLADINDDCSIDASDIPEFLELLFP